MCKHAVYTTIVNFQMNIVYRRKIKNRKKKKKNEEKNFKKLSETFTFTLPCGASKGLMRHHKEV